MFKICGYFSRLSARTSIFLQHNNSCVRNNLFVFKIKQSYIQLFGLPTFRSMNESYFENLSDVELRQELQKYGFPIMPVTETTRNLLIKKLKSYVLNGSTASKSTSCRRSLQKTAATSRKQTTSAGRRSNASPSRRQTTATATYTNSNNNSNDYSTSSASSNTRDLYLSIEGRSYLNRDYDNYPSVRTSTTRSTLGENSNTPPSKSNFNSSYTTKSSPKMYVPPPIMSTDMPYTSSRVAYSSSPRVVERSPVRNGRETTGVVSRLLKLRDITIRRSPQTASPASTGVTNHLYLSDSDSDNGSPTRYSSTNNRRYNRTYSDNLWTRLNIKSKFKQSSVPYLLISCFGLFFLILAILYMTKPPDMPSTMLEKSTTFTLCDEFLHRSAIAKPSINCIESDVLASSLALNKELIQLLQANIETHYCKDRTINPEVSGTELIKYIYKKRTTDAHKLLKSLHASLYLVEHNPQWKIQILNKPEGQLLPDIYKQDIRFGLLRPYLPMKCILFNKMQRFFLIIGTVFLTAILIAVSFVIWRYWQQCRQMRLKIIDNFTKEIIKELTNRVSLKDDTLGEIIINHLRDKLIPLNKRKSLLPAWNEALQKLEASDSRIQFGSILQNGEEFRTMKWVESIISISSTSSPSSSIAQQNNSDERLKKKHWQSPAFDNVNKIFDPPTPCLKIRHMFDPAEANLSDLKQNIIESILEKVGTQCRIYDIQLDRQSCCVYIRCASEKDAGIVHNEINGWWFDNRLVSIKFLRLQRYLTRFPNSTSTIPIAIKNSN